MMKQTILRFGVMAASATLAIGCSSEEPANDPIVLLMAQDSTPTGTPMVDGGLSDDVGTPDSTVVLLDEPLGRVYLNDPATDNGALSEVTLHSSADPMGKLTSEWVQVFNCLNEDGGVVAMPNFGGFNITIALCNEKQTVTPDPDGHYLSIEPPQNDSDPNDQFAELMMYHHVNLAHDYFKETHGFADLDYPLPALVNVQVKVDPPLPFLNAGPDGWIGLSNAAFFPKEAWRQFAAQFGLPPRDSDSIVFFQGDQDFAYDSRVIYHEYTHAVVGTGRLSAPAVLDETGLDMAPRSMNEGLADFFAASISDDPVIGNYVGVMGLGLRDLTVARTCPNYLLDEVHAQGEIIGSALWTLREMIGAELTEAIAYRALEQFTPATNHNSAVQLMIAAAAEIGPEVEAETNEAFDLHGLLNCERELQWQPFSASITGLPHLVEGTQTTGVIGFANGAPAYKQFFVENTDNAAGVQLSWTLASGGQGGIPGFGGGGMPSPLSILIKSGAQVDVIRNRFVEFEYDYSSTPELVNNRQTVVIAAECFEEDSRLYTLFTNSARDQVSISAMAIQSLDALPDTPNVVRCGSPDAPQDGGTSSGDAATSLDAGIADVSVDDTPDAGAPEQGDAAAPIQNDAG